ncbi:unnamed protein product [Dibothriocephalus latus]|uniref:Uncharacterized protein n=1 Tax=Dibothriocephalus latus TaxID=60516 RepID=A0A3P7MQN1_DIBLA|nr:unnamed protein product [Dibothriocephalus latus]
MKSTVDKILKDVQLLSKRMRTREQTADELLNKATELNLQLEAMRQAIACCPTPILIGCFIVLERTRLAFCIAFNAQVELSC